MTPSGLPTYVPRCFDRKSGVCRRALAAALAEVLWESQDAFRGGDE